MCDQCKRELFLKEDQLEVATGGGESLDRWDETICLDIAAPIGRCCGISRKNGDSAMLKWCAHYSQTTLYNGNPYIERTVNCARGCFTNLAVPGRRYGSET